MKDTSIIRTILFNILVIITILFIYLFFFPKKSYIGQKISNKSTSDIDVTFKENIRNMKIASDVYFEDNKENKVTVKRLMEKNLIAEIKDSNGESCDTESYVEKENEKVKIKLNCNDKSDEITLDNSEKFICIYQYEKILGEEYTKWSEWSNWQEEKVESNDLTNVETKQEKIKDGTKKETKEKKNEIDATLNQCPEGYTKTKNGCMSKKPTNTIPAGKDYSCPSGYNLKSNYCYKGNLKKEPTINYSCPTDGIKTHFELNKDKCNVYTIKKNSEYYTCPNDYKLSNNKCYKIETYEEEVENYKEITMYKYQTREKNKKIDIKWSKINDKDLIKQEYNMVGKLVCEL